MINLIKINKIIFCSIICIFLCTSITNATENKIILKVENLIVTSFELKNKIKTDLILRKMEINQENINQVKQSSLYTLLNLKIKESELQKFNIEVTNADVEKQITAITSSNISEIKKMYLLNEIDYKLFYNEVKTEIAWQQFVFSLYGDKLNIDENEITEEIKNLIKSQSGVIEYKISEIELLFEDEAKSKSKILFIKKKIEEIGFEAAAIQFSVSSSAVNKGDLGWINEKALSDEFKKIIKTMKVGDVSKPLINLQNVIFLKLVKKKISKINESDIKKLKETIIDNKKNDLFNLYSKSLLSKVKNNSLIITYE